MRGEIYLFSTGRKKTHKNMFPSVVLLRFVACLFFAQTAVHTRNKSRDTSKYTGITGAQALLWNHGSELQRACSAARCPALVQDQRK